MCGRFGLFTLFPDLAVLFGLEPGEPYAARYNLAPSQWSQVCREIGGKRRLDSLRWGLVPSWAHDSQIGARMINARSETACDKPAFREAFRRRRCLVPADGFYEWAGERGRRVPHWFRLRTGGPFAMAGLWERWASPDGSALQSFTVLTTSANEVVARVHDRMPVILDPADFSLWLGSTVATGPLTALLRPFSAEQMESHRVSARVNDVRIDDAECVVARLPRERQGELF